MLKCDAYKVKDESSGQTVRVYKEMYFAFMLALKRWQFGENPRILTREDFGMLWQITGIDLPSLFVLSDHLPAIIHHFGEYEMNEERLYLEVSADNPCHDCFYFNPHMKARYDKVCDHCTLNPESKADCYHLPADEAEAWGRSVRGAQFRYMLAKMEEE